MGRKQCCSVRRRSAAPRGTRSPFLAEFDPFWARIEEAGLLVALHASDSGYQRYLNSWEGSGDAEYVAFRPKTFAAVADDGRSIQDTLASAICHGMLTRFPGVRLMSVENGGSWVGHLVRNLELAHKKMPQEFPEHPRDVFERNVWVNPFWEDSVTASDRARRRRTRVLRLRLPPPRGFGRSAGMGPGDRRDPGEGRRADHVRQPGGAPHRLSTFALLSLDATEGPRSMTFSPVEFDPFSAEYFEDPSEVYRRLRDEDPVHFSPTYGFYALSRYADVVVAHRDWQGLSSAHGVELSTLSKDPELIAALGMIIMMDPPEHHRFRALVSRVFTPRAVTALEPMVREVITDLLDPLVERESFDVVSDFSAPFPVEVISRMLGVPSGERQQIREWLDLSLHRETGEMEPTLEGQTALLELAGYFYELTLEKRRRPADDMLTQLTQVTVDRGDGVQTDLTDNEIAGFATLLGGAGAETVTKLIGNAAVVFSSHPDQWLRVTTDPARIPDAVEEVLRYLPPSQYQGRFSMEDRTYEGGTIPAGYPVLLLTGAATRDPRAFEIPMRSTSTDRSPSASPSGTVCTPASEPPSHAWRAASPLRNSPFGGSSWRFRRAACSGSTWRTWPVTRTCR